MNNGHVVDISAQNLVELLHNDLKDMQDDDMRHSYIMCILMRAIMMELEKNDPKMGTLFYSELAAAFQFMLSIDDRIDNDHKLHVLEMTVKSIEEDAKNGNGSFS